MCLAKLNKPGGFDLNKKQTGINDVHRRLKYLNKENLSLSLIGDIKETDINFFHIVDSAQEAFEFIKQKTQHDKPLPPKNQED